MSRGSTQDGWHTERPQHHRGMSVRTAFLGHHPQRVRTGGKREFRLALEIEREGVEHLGEQSREVEISSLLSKAVGFAGHPLLGSSTLRGIHRWQIVRQWMVDPLDHPDERRTQVLDG